MTLESDDSLPQKCWYPIHPKMWDAFIELGWTEEKLIAWGFLKTEPLTQDVVEEK